MKNNNNNNNNIISWVKSSKIFINDDPRFYDEARGFNLYQICLIEDFPLPRFCYHEKLSISGNCRVCLVEEEGITKLILSCATLPKPDLSIYTDSELVKDSQEAMFEYLLVNHPLDCPVCDQGGECDLQDQTIAFGSDRGRFYEDFKRSVEDKNYGPLIKTILNRCIHCSRCTRFLDEIAGNDSLTFVNRGMDMQISSYIEKFINTELSGNIIDLCPVGALTSKPYAFLSRLWETESLKFIDIMDALHSNIEVHTWESKILRITPEINDWLNDDWISDKIRFSYDSWMSQRILNPWFIITISQKLQISWRKALYIIRKYFEEVLNFYLKKKKKFILNKIIIGDFMSSEDLLLIKYFANLLGCSDLTYTYNNNNERLNDLRFKFFFNTRLHNLTTDNNNIKNYLYFIIGLNPRYESPILNIKLKNLHPSTTYVILIGFLSNFTYDYIHFGSNIINFIYLLEFSNIFQMYFKKFTDYFWIFGNTFYFRLKYGNTFWNFICKYISKNFNLLNVSHLHCSDTAILELNTLSNFNNNNFENINFTYNIFYSLNNNNWNYFKFNKIKSLNIYQGWHSDYSIGFSNLVLPTKLFIEKPSTFINSEGLVQNLRRFYFKYEGYKTTKFDSKIWLVLLEMFDFIIWNHQEDENRKELLLKKYLLIPKNKSTYFYISFFNKFFNKLLANSIKSKESNFNFFFNKIIYSVINNFYLNNSILRNSKIMSMCSKYYTVYNDFKYIITYLMDDS